jgi:hypothetical protein
MEGLYGKRVSEKGEGVKLKVAYAARSPQQVELVGSSVVASGRLLPALPVVVVVVVAVVVFVAAQNVEEGLSVLTRTEEGEEKERQLP